MKSQQAEAPIVRSPQRLNGPAIPVNIGRFPQQSYTYKSIPGSPGLKVDRSWLNNQSKTQVLSWGDHGLPIHIYSKVQGSHAKAIAASDQLLFQQSIAHLNSIQAILGLKDPSRELQLKDIERDNLGFAHIKLSQVYQGIPLYASEMSLHYSPDNEIIMTGRYQPTPSLTDIHPNLDVDAAIQVAMNELANEVHVRELTEAEQELLNYVAPQTQLVIYETSGFLRQQKLAWHLVIRPNLLHRWEYIIDAKTGEILNEFDHTCTIGPVSGSGQDLNGQNQTLRLYEFGTNQYTMINSQTSMYKFPNDPNRQPNGGDGVIVTLDWQNNRVNNNNFVEVTSNNINNWSNVSVSAHNNAAVVYEYFENTFGRQSYDGQGGDLISFINVADDDGGGFDNAFWNGAAMFYGNGRQAFSPLAGALDVAAHEIAHGVVQETANLVYQDEPGALNESFADVFGVLVDRDDFGLGEDIIPNTNIFPTGLLRDVSNPNNGFPAGSNPLQTNGYQPANVSEQFRGTQDNGGVHINSGIPNKAFHNFATSTSKAIAEQVYYRALTQYMTRSSKFIDCRIAVIQAASDLHGANSSQVTAARAAFDAVGITDGSGTNTNPTVPVNPGNESIVSSDVNAGDPNTLYVSTSTGTDFMPLSQSTHRKKISVTDDGSTGYFADSTGSIHQISMNPNSPSDQILFANQGWPAFDNVAVSKDGSKLAMLTTLVDTSMYIVSFTRNEFLIYKLFNPTTAQGVSTGDVLFADVISWDLSGENVLYDGFNIIRSPNSADIEYWDLGLIRVWDNSTGNFGDGQVFKLFSGLQPGESVGNAVFSKNSPNVIAFDFFNNTTNENLVMAANIETGALGTIFQNSQLGYPTYSVNDGQLLFDTPVTSQGQTVPGIAVIDLAADKINPAGNAASALIAQGRWAEWYADGQRDTNTGLEEYVEESSLSLFPNPTTNFLRVEYELKETAEVQIEVLDMLGNRVSSQNANTRGIGINTEEISVADLPAGIYLLQLQVEDGSQTLKFVKQ
ncbi:MAG: M4 family metallopeptidase [Bacteroidia bacterium]|nr:M4 family metallopeptidase [Bacteroidia bacterium]